MAQLIGRNEGVEYVKKMVHQRESVGMEYPSDTNMRGSSNRHHHAEGDMVEADKDRSQKHSFGDMVNTVENAFHADGDMVSSNNKKARGGMMRQRHADGDMVMPVQAPNMVRPNNLQNMASSVGQTMRNSAAQGMHNPIRPTSTVMDSNPRQI